jgi:glyoxylase-like metal-dependent hydrolase (beta-lactamase superfamily II)
VRVVAVHEDVLVGTSAIWQTNCCLIHAGDEAFLVDSPLLPEELEALPGVAEHVGWPVSGLLATHADWDHLLGRLAFPGAALGCAETSAARLAAEPGAAARSLRAFDDQQYLDRPAPLSLGQVQALPVPGTLELGEHEIELHPADGHTKDGMALLAPWAGVLACGDYLSEVEIPTFFEAGGSLSAYRATLERLRPLVERAEHVVPGHGPVLGRERALEILDEDLRYLDDLFPPAGRSGETQMRNHERNLEALES